MEKNDTVKTVDTTTKICPLCDNKLAGKQTYCSEACKQKAKRLRTIERTIPTEPKTELDAEFEKYNPNFYKYSDTVREDHCILCKKKFKTSLPALSACSVEHFEAILKKITV